MPKHPGNSAALGHAYITFALANPALFDLMFRPSELHPADPDLRQAQQEAIGVLDAAATAAGGDGAPREGSRTAPGELTLISWALAHGLAVLAATAHCSPPAPAGTPAAPSSPATSWTPSPSGSPKSAPSRERGTHQNGDLYRGKDTAPHLPPHERELCPPVAAYRSARGLIVVEVGSPAQAEHSGRPRLP